MVKAITLRFVRVFLSSVVATLGTVTVAAGTWDDVPALLSALGLAAVIGAISGLIAAVDKWVRYIPEE